MTILGPGAAVLVASHERSGTHLTIDLLRRHFPACSVRMRPLEQAHNAYLSLDRFFENAHRPMSRGAAEAQLARAPGLPLKTHAEPDFHEVGAEHHAFVTDLAERAHKLYVIRNPLKVLCSHFAWMHSWRGEATGDFQDFLREPDPHHGTRIERWAEHARAWARTPGVMVVRYEDLIGDTVGELLNIRDHIGYQLTLKERVLPKRVRGLRSKLTTRVTGRYESTNLAGARTLTPKPAQVFTREDFELLLDVAGDVMQKFDYDTSDHWLVDQPELAGRVPERGAAVLS